MVLSVLFRYLGTVCFTPLALSSCGTTAESNLECGEAWEIGKGKENICLFFLSPDPQNVSVRWRGDPWHTFVSGAREVLVCVRMQAFQPFTPL